MIPTGRKLNKIEQRQNSKIFILLIYYSIIMSDKTVPLKLPSGLVEELDELVEEGRFHNRSEVLRHGARIVIYIERGLLPLSVKAEHYAYDEIKGKFERLR